MADIIQLLPDSVANQIAAGEVIQRPASVVKELLENSVDAGSTFIQLIIKEAGRTLIQVIDNGCGMSDSDARMCFERHATSKIREANDLFAIRTKGFRGEAMASIAAIAHVEMKTRLHDQELGTRIDIEGSEVKRQELFHCPPGTSIAVKNLFYNVPARRNFLKSNSVETKHIIEEFQRLTLAHPEVGFSMHNDGKEVFHLKAGSIRQRIVEIFGNPINEKLVPLEEETSIIKITGYIGKPEYARKTRGEQYFFVNNRFIKSPYLHHAVQSAFNDLLNSDSFPSYFLYFDVKPDFIDINIHPTKTEIKFEDEKSVYAILRSAVKLSLGKFNIAPTIDFEMEASMDIPPPPKNMTLIQPEIKFNKDYNPFKIEKATSSERTKDKILERSKRDDWRKLYEDIDRHAGKKIEPEIELKPIIPEEEQEKLQVKKQHYQLHNRYIISHIKSGMMLIDQHRAHERILYENFLASLEVGVSINQQHLFPHELAFSPADFNLLLEMEEDLRNLGISLRQIGKNTFAVDGVASHFPSDNIPQLLDDMLEFFKNEFSESRNRHDALAKSLARKSAIKYGKVLSTEEMSDLVDKLFACKMPYYSPIGKPVIIKLSLDDLEKKFQK